MALRRQLWHPDTCSCTIEEEWDDSVPAESRVHTPISITPCPLHASIANLADRHIAVREYNTRKNRLIGRAMESLGVQLEDILWVYEGGVLKVTIAGTTVPQKTAMQNWCDTNLGIGKVIIN